MTSAYGGCRRRRRKIAQTYADRVLAVHFKEWCYTTDARDIHGMSRDILQAWSGNLCRGQPRRGNALLERGYTGWFYIEQDTHHRER